MDDRQQVNPESAKKRLLVLRAELAQILETHQEGGALEPDKTRSGRLSRLDELHSQAMDVEAVRRRKRELARIDAALRRLQEEEYGFCADCGNPIALGRLAADPAVELCIRCATNAEGHSPANAHRGH